MVSAPVEIVDVQAAGLLRRPFIRYVERGFRKSTRAQGGAPWTGQLPLADMSSDGMVVATPAGRLAQGRCDEATGMQKVRRAVA
jgi:hypothetical protein